MNKFSGYIIFAIKFVSYCVFCSNFANKNIAYPRGDLFDYFVSVFLFCTCLVVLSVKLNVLIFDL